MLLATVAQLAVAQWVPGIERFEGKAFGARLVAYPLLMLVVPALWWVVVGRRRTDVAVPHGAFALVMLGFLVDVTGNTLDLYDTVTWWDDANHLLNWLLLLLGLGLLVGGRVEPAWALVLVVTGLGALLAVAWEAGEWWTFIRHGTELDTAYADTLGDELLGTTGALLAGLALALRRRRRDRHHDAARSAAGAAPRTAPSGSALRPALLLPTLAWLALVGLLVAGVVLPLGDDPAAVARLVAYPLLALVLPLVWLLGRPVRPLPAVAATLLVAPFLLDTVGNLADLYARIGWWDELLHPVNWLLLGTGVGLAARGSVRPRWALGLLVVGIGAALAVAWEGAEWAFFYDPPFSARLYEDTLLDQGLGTAGALLAALVAVAVAEREERLSPRRPSPAAPGPSAPRRGGSPG